MTKQNPPSHSNSRIDISIELNKIKTLACIVEYHLNGYASTFTGLNGVDSEDSILMQGLVWIMSDIRDSAENASNKLF